MLHITLPLDAPKHITKSICHMASLLAAVSRVALAPASVAALSKKGFTVSIESNAGIEAKYPNSAFEEAGAKIVDRNAAFTSGG